jgi:hypothetical protein
MKMKFKNKYLWGAYCLMGYVGTGIGLLVAAFNPVNALTEGVFFCLVGLAGFVIVWPKIYAFFYEV